MKKWIALLAAVPLLFVTAATAFAADYDYEFDGEPLYLGEDVLWDDDLFYVGESLVISGVVLGDVYAIGGAVEVDGRIDGDLYVVAGSVKVSGVVSQDVLAVTEDLNLDGAMVGDSVLTGASNVKVDSDTNIGGAMMMASNVANVDANIGRGFWAVATNLRTSANVEKSMKVSADQLELQNGAVVGGDLQYVSVHELELNEGAEVRGEVTWIERSEQASEFKEARESAERGVDLGFLLWSYVGALIIGFLIIRFWPRVLEVSTEEMLKDPLSSAAYGALYLFGGVVAFFFLLISVFGVPLAWLLSMDYVAALYLAKILIAAATGAQLAKWFKWKKANPYGLMAIGMFIYYVLKSLPYVGPILRFVAVLIAIGGAIKMVIRATAQLAKKKW